jgi:3'(2'), 5'-bisphosphate nucleotidase
VNPTEDAALAFRLAEDAGRLLMTARAQTLVTGKALGDLGDVLAHQFLMRALGVHRPDDAVLSEEGARDPERLSRSRVWIVDPLDGTREYAEGRSDWAVHVALTVDGRAILGAVAQPGLGHCYRSDQPCDRLASGGLKIMVSRTRPPEAAERAARTLGAELVPMGSAGAKTMAVVRGEADAYIHAGGQYEWDSAAPVAVAEGAGLHASRLDGSPLIYNREDPYLPDLVVCRRDLAEQVLAAVR